MTANRVDKVLVTSGTQGATIGALTSGQFLIEVKGKANNSVLTAEDTFRIVVKAPNGEVLKGDWIKASNITNISKETAVAKVEQVTTVTIGTLEAGEEYNLTIVDTSDREIFSYRQNKRVYTVKTSASGQEALKTAELAALINADEASPVTATSTSTTVVLTAKPVADQVDKAGILGKQKVFKVSFYKAVIRGFNVQQGTVAVTTGANFGKGQGFQVRALEDGQTGYHDGYLNRTLWPFDAYPYGSTLSGSYNVYIIEDTDVHSTNSVVLNNTDAPRTNIIAATADTALDAIFTDLLGL